MWGIPLPGLLPAALTAERLQSYAPNPSSVTEGAGAAPPVQGEGDVSEDDVSEDDIAAALVKRKNPSPLGGRRPSRRRQPHA